MIMGGFVPCIYYGFYCRFTEKVMYIVALNLLGAGCIVVSLWNKFASPKYRPLRAGSNFFYKLCLLYFNVLTNIYLLFLWEKKLGVLFLEIIWVY